MDSRGQACFVEEHFDEFLFPSQMRVEAFDGEEPLEPTNTREASEVHRRHAA